MELTFLSGALPLTKKIIKNNGKIKKEGYPKLALFTSETHTVDTIGDFYKALTTHGTKGACLLKGILSKPLENELRKGKMPPDTATEWLCFDLDRAPFSTPEEFMRAVKLSDVSYVIQYSASYKLDPHDKTLSAHIFVLLDKAMRPGDLKAWLMYLNLNTPVLEGAITLSASQSFLHWPLDITTCQNDKLLYTTPPILVGLKDPLTKRIELVVKNQPTLPTPSMALKPMEEMKTKARTKLNALRAAAGLKNLTRKTKVVGEYIVQPGVDEVTTYEAIDCGDYWRYNLNGGDSQAYWHPKNNWELLHSFKGEDSMYLKEVMPERYRELNEAQRTNNQTSNTSKDLLLLAFREKRTAEYWKGTYDGEALDIHKVKDLTMLDHFLQSHGSALGPFVPEYEFYFDPKNPVVVDTDNRRVNRFVPTQYMREPVPGKYTIIKRVIDHAVGTGPIQEHFLNWAACLIQYREKLITHWVLHGNQGTGKGLIIDKVLGTILGPYYKYLKASTLKSDFNGWQEYKLLVMIDEMEIEMFEEGNRVDSDLKTYTVSPISDINRKGVNQYSVPSYECYVLCSNKPKPISLAPSDRRYNVGQFQHNPLIITRADATTGIESEIEAFAHYLMTREANLDLANKILHTEDRQAIMDLSMTSVDELANAIVKGKIEKLFEFMPDERLANEHGLVSPVSSAYAALMRKYINEARSYVTRDELAILFEHGIGRVPEGKNKFTTYLRHHGIHTKRIKLSNELHYGIVVDWDIDAKTRMELLQSLAPSTKLRRVK